MVVVAVQVLLVSNMELLKGKKESCNCDYTAATLHRELADIDEIGEDITDRFRAYAQCDNEDLTPNLDEYGEVFNAFDVIEAFIAGEDPPEGPFVTCDKGN